MGRYYATAQGETPAVAVAMEDHYRPQGPSDRVPTEPVSIAVALADKLDTLIGFWAIDEKPTGSKDPFALRRAALGVIRVVIENGLRIGLRHALTLHGLLFLTRHLAEADRTAVEARERQDLDLMGFFADRLKVYLRDKGARHDLIDAVFALSGQDDLVLVVRRVEALGRFLETEDGRNLLAGYRRAANILKAEEKRDGAGAFDGFYEPAQFVAEEERHLGAALTRTAGEVAEGVGREDFAAAMVALAALRAPVDAFFERVTVNADEPALRMNRLRLLSALRRAMLAVADFARIVDKA